MTIQQQHFRAKELFPADSGRIIVRLSFASKRNRDPVSSCRNCVILSRETGQVVTPFSQFLRAASHKPI